MKTATQKTLINRSLVAAASMLLVGTGALLWSNQARAKCDDDGAHGKAASVKDGADHAGHSAKSSHAALGQKANGSGVRFSANTPKTMAIGQPTRVMLNFDAVSTDGAVAKLQVPAGMTVTRADGSALGEIALERGRATNVEAFVTAQGDGMQYLDVVTSQGGRASVQSVALKVGSGAVSLKSNGNLVTTPSGEKVISMPAK